MRSNSLSLLSVKAKNGLVIFKGCEKQFELCQLSGTGEIQIKNKMHESNQTLSDNSCLIGWHLPV
jgi:hypothetical protein